MMERFFDLRHEGNTAFEGLPAVQRRHHAFCKEWVQQYPTILISLKDVKGRSFEVSHDLFTQGR
jgi:hypothetical protein